MDSDPTCMINEFMKTTWNPIMLSLVTII